MNKILYLFATFFLFISCSSEQTVDTYQKRLINDVLIPINISHHHYQCNVQLLNQDKVSEMVEYNKNSSGEVSNKYLYTFRNGKLSTVYQIYNKVKIKESEFDYDNKGRLKKIQNFRDENKIYHFDYNKYGLIDKVTDESGASLFSSTYQFDKDGNVVKIVQYYPKQGKANTHNFIKNDFKNKSYLLNFYVDTVLTYDSMPFAFNSNGTMKEVLGEEYDSTGIPIRIILKRGVREIETEVDYNGNWILQKIGDSYSEEIREIKYK
jgi:hypothetical protein